MLRRQFIALLFFVLASLPMLAAEELVPESTSPNGKFAISYGPPHSYPNDKTPQVWFINLRTHHHVSAQLAPSDKTIYRLERIKGVETLVYRNEATGVYADDRQMLWTTLVEGIKDQREGRGDAVNASIIWNDDSQRVAVRVNNHKFTHTSVFRLRKGWFRRVNDYDE